MAEENTFPTGRPGQLDLEAHGAFVRALAAHLLGRAEFSKDVAQETLVAAIQSKEAGKIPAASMKAWLSKIVSRKALRQRKLERSRRDREEAYGRDRLERGPAISPEAESVRGETIQTVTNAVLCLEEPYLQTVLLRFYEDMDAHQIAERMGVSVATVRSRIQRAKSQLQSQLESEFGGSSEHMSLALLPLLTPRSSGVASVSTGAALIGTVTMGFKAKVAAAGVGMVGLLGWYGASFAGLFEGAEAPPSKTSQEQALNPFEGQTSHAAVAPVPISEQRNREALAQEAPVQAKQEVLYEPPTAGLFGRVLHKANPSKG